MASPVIIQQERLAGASQRKIMLLEKFHRKDYSNNVRGDYIYDAVHKEKLNMDVMEISKSLPACRSKDLVALRDEINSILDERFEKEEKDMEYSD